MVLQYTYSRGTVLMPFYSCVLCRRYRNTAMTNIVLRRSVVITLTQVLILPCRQFYWFVQRICFSLIALTASLYFSYFIAISLLTKFTYISVISSDYHLFILENACSKLVKLIVYEKIFRNNTLKQFICREYLLSILTYLCMCIYSTPTPKLSYLLTRSKVEHSSAVTLQKSYANIGFTLPSSKSKDTITINK